MTKLATPYMALLLAGALPISAQDSDRTNAIAAALEWQIERWAASEADPFDRMVLDRRRTGRGEGNQPALVRNLADELGIELGVIEAFCRPLPPDERGMLQSEVRDGVAVLAANILDWQGDSAEVELLTWSGSGYHTGWRLTMEVRKGAVGWEAAELLVSGSGACIPGDGGG